VISGTPTETYVSASWWVGACCALAVGAGVAWLVLFYSPHSLSDLGRQMIAVLVIVISLAPVLLIKPSSEEGALP
jgi:hypothetical protein